MKITLFASAFAVLALTACETTTPMEAVSSGPVEITTLEQFTSMIVGKRLRHAESNFFTVHNDGTLSGNFGGKALEGTWQWEDRYWCRTLTTVRLGTDCQAWSVDGNEITVVRERETAGTATYFFQ